MSESDRAHKWEYVALFDHQCTFHGMFLVPKSWDLQREFNKLATTGQVSTVAEFAKLLTTKACFPLRYRTLKLT